MGRGELQGRAASLCMSEIRLCITARTDANDFHAQADHASNFGGSIRPKVTRITRRRLRLHELRELARISLAFAIDPIAATYARGTTLDIANGGAMRMTGTRTDASNRRMLMLDALPVIVAACCSAAAAEEGEQNEDVDRDSDRDWDGDREDAWSPCQAPHVKRGLDSTTNCKGKRKKPELGAGVGRENRKRLRRPRSLGIDSPRLPLQGEEVLLEVTNSLLNQPWAPELALPLLVMFQEISDLIDLLGTSSTGERARYARGRSPGNVYGSDITREGLWILVRSRLMECVWMGGMDGADFTGVVRQVIIPPVYRQRHDFLL